MSRDRLESVLSKSTGEARRIGRFRTSMPMLRDQFGDLSSARSMGVSAQSGQQNSRHKTIGTTHQKVLWRVPLIRLLVQTALNEVLRVLWETALGCQPRRGFVYDVLQELQDTHHHSATLQAHAPALPFLLLVSFHLLRSNLRRSLQCQVAWSSR